jgi:hypothetical protein
MQPVTGAAPLTEADRERIRSEEIREEQEERRRIDELLSSETTLLRLPAYLAHPLAVSFLLGMSALLGLFLFAQVNTALAALTSMPEGLRYAGYFGLILLTGAALFAFGRCAFLYFRLSSNRPISLKGLEQLSQRTRLRWLVHEKKGEAKEHLSSYLQSHPVGTPQESSILVALGLSEEKIRQLQTTRADLLDMNRFASNDAWFALFGTRFQAILDETAQDRISYFARRVGLMTAVSPNALVDSLLTFYCGFMMIGDLCRIYNLRVGRLGTIVLLGHVFFNAYIAGELNELEGVTEAGLEGFWAEIGAHVGSQALDATIGKVVSKVGSRTISGTLNYLLMKRLGRYAQRSLRPVQSY